MYKCIVFKQEVVLERQQTEPDVRERTQWNVCKNSHLRRHVETTSYCCRPSVRVSTRVPHILLYCIPKSNPSSPQVGVLDGLGTNPVHWSHRNGRFQPNKNYYGPYRLAQRPHNRLRHEAHLVGWRALRLHWVSEPMTSKWRLIFWLIVCSWRHPDICAGLLISTGRIVAWFCPEVYHIRSLWRSLRSGCIGPTGTTRALSAPTASLVRPHHRWFIHSTS